MKEIKLTKQDYKNALEIWLSYLNGDSVLFFIGYLEKIIDELEQPETPQYRCIQLPPSNNGMFKIGNLYANTYWSAGLCLSDLPNHFELVVPEPKPEPKPEKITWQEVVTVTKSFIRKTYLPQAFYIELIKILERIKTDHLS